MFVAHFGSKLVPFTHQNQLKKQRFQNKANCL